MALGATALFVRADSMPAAALERWGRKVQFIEPSWQQPNDARPLTIVATQPVRLLVEIDGAWMIVTGDTWIT